MNERIDTMDNVRMEADSLGEIGVPADRLWGAQTQRSLEHFSIGRDLMPREMITAYVYLKKASANANYAGGRLGDQSHRLITQVCDEILAGQQDAGSPERSRQHVAIVERLVSFGDVHRRCCQHDATPGSGGQGIA